MTVEQYREEITDFYDLKDFCDEHGCHACDDIYSDEGRDDYIYNDIDYYVRNESWRSLADYLGSLSQSSSDWWMFNDYGDWCDVDDEIFLEYRDEVEDWALDRGILVDEEAEEEEAAAEEPESEPEPEEDLEPEEEAFSFSEMMESSYGSVAEELAAIESEREAAVSQPDPSEPEEPAFEETQTDPYDPSPDDILELLSPEPVGAGVVF